MCSKSLSARHSPVYSLSRPAARFPQACAIPRPGFSVGITGVFFCPGKTPCREHDGRILGTDREKAPLPEVNPGGDRDQRRRIDPSVAESICQPDVRSSNRRALVGRSTQKPMKYIPCFVRAAFTKCREKLHCRLPIQLFAHL